MVKPENSEQTDRSPVAPAQPAETGGLAAIESYEVDNGIVFYDPQSPLAWVETSRTVPLADRC